jgi:hypothetical protein
VKKLLLAGGLAVLACGLYRLSRQQSSSPRPPAKPITTFRMRCQSCWKGLLVDTGRHFADRNDTESIVARVACPHCSREHDVAYSPAGAVHRSTLLPPPKPERGSGLWGVNFSSN